jgi:hypothetical protein
VDKKLDGQESGMMLCGLVLGHLSRRVIGRISERQVDRVRSMTVGGTVKKHPASLLAFPLAASMLLAGCSGDSKADAYPPGTTVKSPTATRPAPTTSGAPTTAAPRTDPNIPAAARAHTTAGAEAFVRYYFEQLNVALATPKAGLVSALSVPTCKTCTAYEGMAVDLASKGQHYRGGGFAVKTVGSIGEFEVLVIGEQSSGSVIDIKGNVVKSRTQAQRNKLVLTVPWSNEGWRIHEIQVMK